MSASPASGSSKRRVRTEAQMSQKRLADRVKHKENRQEHKQRMERMEADIAQIRKNLDDVSAQLRTLPQLGADLVAAQQRSLQQRPAAAVNLNFGSALGVEATFNGIDRMAAATTTSISSNTTTTTTPAFPAAAAAAARSLASLGRAPDPPLSSACPEHEMPPAAAAISLSSLFPTPPPVVDCRCGVQHYSQSTCLEYCSFAILYENHAALAQDPMHARSLPRNPTLPNLTLHSYGDNVVTCFLTSFLKDFQLASVETLFGIYFFAYRLMRWRLHPDPMTLRDVPAWLLPTEVQNTFPHPVSIDYIPWPDLRDFLCTHQRLKSRHSVKIYLESLRLKWPPGCPMLALDSGGQVSISPEFEAIACDLRNWDLGSPWADAFPRLASLIHP
ncbi:hypothetical protein ACJ41O_010934 [Fusarium nematophilum]